MGIGEGEGEGEGQGEGEIGTGWRGRGGGEGGSGVGGDGKGLIKGGRVVEKMSGFEKGLDERTFVGRRDMSNLVHSPSESSSRDPRNPLRSRKDSLNLENSGMAPEKGFDFAKNVAQEIENSVKSRQTNPISVIHETQNSQVESQKEIATKKIRQLNTKLTDGNLNLNEKVQVIHRIRGIAKNTHHYIGVDHNDSDCEDGMQRLSTIRNTPDNNDITDGETKVDIWIPQKPEDGQQNSKLHSKSEFIIEEEPTSEDQQTGNNARTPEMLPKGYGLRTASKVRNYERTVEPSGTLMDYTLKTEVSDGAPVDRKQLLIDKLYDQDLDLSEKVKIVDLIREIENIENGLPRNHHLHTKDKPRKVVRRPADAHGKKNAPLTFSGRNPNIYQKYSSKSNSKSNSKIPEDGKSGSNKVLGKPTAQANISRTDLKTTSVHPSSTNTKSKRY